AYVMPENLQNTVDRNIVEKVGAKILRTEQFAERFDVCFTFAITEQLGITGQAPKFLPVSSGISLITECDIVNKYYEQVLFPQVDDLVVYTDDSLLMKHFS